MHLLVQVLLLGIPLEMGSMLSNFVDRSNDSCAKYGRRSRSGARNTVVGSNPNCKGCKECNEIENKVLFGLASKL